jgi:hypothetical protein
MRVVSPLEGPSSNEHAVGGINKMAYLELGLITMNGCVQKMKGFIFPGEIR